jgi:hypothetical protein
VFADWRHDIEGVANVIQHDVGFPRVVRAEDAERAALYAMLVSLGATKLMDEQLMQVIRSTRSQRSSSSTLPATVRATCGVRSRT